MKWELDDNARSGFHYLVLGVVVIGGFRLGFWGLYSLAYRGLPLEEVMFLHGYIGLGPGSIVVAHHSAVERLLVAVAISLLIALLSGLVFSLLFRKDQARTFRRMVVAGLIVTVPWAIWAALFAPIRSTQVLPDAILNHYRQELVFDLPMPFGHTEQLVFSGEVLRIECGHPDASRKDEVHRSDISMLTIHGKEVLGSAWYPDPDVDIESKDLDPSAQKMAQLVANAVDAQVIVLSE
ncbi:MAG: hypothetical protein IPO90_16775 [Flavobacteriales bacterium]|nr:hypothetical protein [Flavobacteriales bacterium]